MRTKSLELKGASTLVHAMLNWLALSTDHKQTIWRWIWQKVRKNFFR